jgi:hypothetical protein
MDMMNEKCKLRKLSEKRSMEFDSAGLSVKRKTKSKICNKIY